MAKRINMNNLTLPQHFKINEWLNENWKTVEKHGWTSTETCTRITKELGFLVTDGNLKRVLKECHPGKNFMHAAMNPNNPVALLKQKADAFDALKAEIDGLKATLERLQESAYNGSAGYSTRLAKLEKVCSENFQAMDIRIKDAGHRVYEAEKRVEGTLAAHDALASSYRELRDRIDVLEKIARVPH